MSRLEVYCGSMFAEKSTNLLRQAKRHLIAGRKVVILKPETDNRYGTDVVATHDGKVMKAINIYVDYDSNYVDNITSSSVIPEIKEAEVICIDEIQFFPELIVNEIRKILRFENKHVYVAGLDMDRKGIPFNTTIQLMGIADKVIKFNAVCQDCGEDAYVTVKENDVEAERILVGNDGYKPVCRSCSHKYLKGW